MRSHINTEIHNPIDILNLILNDANYIKEFFMGFNSVICLLMAIGICYIMRDHSKIITYDTLLSIENFILCRRDTVEGFENYEDLESPV
jgi:hypothetical protein